MTRSLLRNPLSALPLALFVAVGCGAPDGDGGGTDSTIDPNQQEGGGIGTIDPGVGDLPTTVSDDRDLPVREKICDELGNCSCLRLALVGTLKSSANDNDSTLFVDWLNANSDGTATAEIVDTKPTITAEWLANYDILITANLNEWTFSADEKAAVETWARETGGGIISLTGFDSVAGEPAATSQLTEWSGVKYNSTKTAENGQSEPVYYNGGSQDLKNCLAWSGGSDAIITTPIPFTAQEGGFSKLTLELDYVGAFIGWGVEAPAGASVVATDPISGSPMVVAHEVDGTGRVLAYGDEWVVFGNQWEPQGNPSNMQMDEYNPCYVPASEVEGESTEAFFHSVKTLYQTKQFWFNAINWVAPPNECGFTVVDEDVTVIR